MREETTFSPRRIRWVCLMLAGLTALSVLYTLRFHFTPDRLLVFVLLHGLVFPGFALLLARERQEGHLYANKKSSYRMHAICFFVMCILYYAFSYLPAYCAPVMIPAMFLTMTSTPVLGLAESIYLDLLLGMVSEGSYYELAAYLILSLSGVILTFWYQKKEYRICVGISIVALSAAVPALLYYCADYERNVLILLYGAACGVLTVLILLLPGRKVRQQAKDELARSIDELLAPDFSLVKDIRNYSETDYAHARNVSKVAYQCAKLVGADAGIVKAAGFYYQLGRMCGEPYINNAVLLAEKNCFPVKVTEILEEYNGICRLPQTKESALVHLVDAVITKFERLGRDTMKNEWNHNMVVYQAMDEQSSTGIYDESGLSMNQYLKIRDYLVKEVKMS